MGIRRNYNIEALKEGKTVSYREKGNSMVPILKSRSLTTVEPVDPDTLQKGDIVYVTVKGNTYTHLLTGIRGEGKEKRFQISNNHGHVNGWCKAEAIHGKLIAIEGVPYRPSK